MHAVASFTVLADVVAHVGGTHVTVTSLVPPDGDPHEFEPAPNDARVLRQADIVFMSGEGLESWFGRLAHAAGYHGTPVIVSRGSASIFRRVADRRKRTRMCGTTWPT